MALYWNPVVNTTHTPDGIIDLGAHAELIPISYELSIQADHAATFKLQAGQMPPGIAVNKNGSISGTPALNVSSEITSDVSGVPSEVSEEEVYTFVIRATDSITNEIADQTFLITITGEDPPLMYQSTYRYIYDTASSLPDPYGTIPESSPPQNWDNTIVFVADENQTYVCSINSDGSSIVKEWLPTTDTKSLLGVYNDGTWIDISLRAIDSDPEDIITYTIVEGSIPPGLTLDRATGKLYGYVEPTELTLNAIYGFASDPYASAGFDEGETVGSRSYNFVLRADDGKIQVTTKYNITIVRLDVHTADLTLQSADTVIITADDGAKHLPVLLDREEDIGIYADDNFFAHKFEGHDFDGDILGYEIVPNEFTEDPHNLLPVRTWISENTGWLYGYLDTIQLGQIEYNFDVRVYKKEFEPNPVSALVDYAIDYPFNYVNGNTQNEMDALYIDIPETNYDGKLFIFTQQEGFDLTAFPGAQPGDDDGWQDLSLTTIPGYDEHILNPTTVQNQRGGIWKCNLVPQAYPTPDYYEFEFVSTVELGQLARAMRHITIDIGDLSSPSVLLRQAIVYADNSPGVPRYTTTNISNPFETLWPKVLNIRNSNNYNITWITDSTLTEVIAGHPATIQFEAANTAGTPIVYRIVSGKMPQGLKLNSNGMLEGKPSLQKFKFIDGLTFDEDTTTFDKVYTFTIEASTTVTDPIKRTITSNREFTVIVDYPSEVPINNLYLEFLLASEDREILHSKLFNDLIVPQELVYRYDDHEFGIQRDFKMLVGYGLNPTTDSAIARAIAAYHHEKRYLFADLKIARAIDSSGNVEYEVIYIDPVDEFTTPTSKWVGDVYLKRFVNNEATGFSETRTADEGDYLNTELINANQDQTLTAYPASEPNMQARLKSRLSDFSLRYLPKWMTSRQSNSQITYWIPAIPIIYVKPGFAKQILFNIQQSGIELNLINAKTDRYYWDNGLSLNWDHANNQFYPNEETTFDDLITSNEYEITDYVDYAVDVPFYRINANVKRNLEIEGVIDSVRNIEAGKTLIFIKQEDFGSDIEYANIDGWGNTINLNDSIDYDSENLEGYEVVPGWNEKQADMTGQTLNKRGGIWRIDINEDNVVRLTCIKEINLPGSTVSIIGSNAYPTTLTIGDNFVINSTTIILTGTTIQSVADDINALSITGITASISEGRLVITSTVEFTITQEDPQVGNALSDLGIETGTYKLPVLQAIKVKSGINYGGSTQVFVSAAEVGPSATVPAYVNYSEVNTASGTEFDGDSMKFIDSNLDVYLPEDKGAKYMIFERKAYLDYGIVDV